MKTTKTLLLFFELIIYAVCDFRVPSSSLHMDKSILICFQNAGYKPACQFPTVTAESHKKISFWGSKSVRISLSRADHSFPQGQPSKNSFNDLKDAGLDDIFQSKEIAPSNVIRDILGIAADPHLTDAERIARIRDALPAPIFPFETEPGMSGETLVAKSFGHLNDLLFLDSWAAQGDKLGSCKLYRGMPDASMELLTSLQRLVEPANHIPCGKTDPRLATGGRFGGWAGAAPAPARLSPAAVRRIEQVASARSTLSHARPIRISSAPLGTAAAALPGG
jgi:hypothetical protein